MATITDVARRAGVSPSVVSRLLNNDPTLRIRDDTRARVLRVVEELDYAPHHAARALRRSQVGALGLAVPDMHNPVYAAILEGARPAATEHGYLLMLTSLDDLASNTTMSRRIVRGGAIDGLLVQRDSPTAARVVDRITARRMPVVVLNERVRAPIAGVAVDDRAAARLATRHLLELGHTEIAHLRVRGNNSRSRDREAGWRDALKEAGLTPRAELVANGGAVPESGFHGLLELLRRPRPPTAVFVGSVLAAVGALTAARHAGLTVPDDLSIIGYHDTWLAEHVDPPLTVVRLPLVDMGREAVRLLVDLINGRPAQQVLLDTPTPELVVRASTAPPRRARRAGARPRHRERKRP
ncbi:LacI family DNA-binding transcriptional regulator [Thermasporomyces composti]|mgnify:CR=1 FL=1|jgi:DNA-binding LacI/PurR family transcriptional regulator|uniref:LacI family transcriptional regulator n=1 Tax=Thermasporomyces composti TaxID=696763 RepID=A0A3D9V8W3_THECX|nr:LacI family DNA-binding transcriptional regulator [Thermasporomyces composti]REF35435.1 LacI family transcriptional regulator [Thermasporomyces composti]